MPFEQLKNKSTKTFDKIADVGDVVFDLYEIEEALKEVNYYFFVDLLNVL